MPLASPIFTISVAVSALSTGQILVVKSAVEPPETSTAL